MKTSLAPSTARAPFRAHRARRAAPRRREPFLWSYWSFSGTSRRFGYVTKTLILKVTVATAGIIFCVVGGAMSNPPILRSMVFGGGVKSNVVVALGARRTVPGAAAHEKNITQAARGRYCINILADTLIFWQ